MKPKDTKQLLTGILNNDTATVKRIVSAYFESCFTAEIDKASKAVMEKRIRTAKRMQKLAK